MEGGWGFFCFFFGFSWARASTHRRSQSIGRSAHLSVSQPHRPGQSVGQLGRPRAQLPPSQCSHDRVKSLCFEASLHGVTSNKGLRGGGGRVRKPPLFASTMPASGGLDRLHVCFEASLHPRGLGGSQPPLPPFPPLQIPCSHDGSGRDSYFLKQQRSKHCVGLGGRAALHLQTRCSLAGVWMGFICCEASSN